MGLVLNGEVNFLTEDDQMFGDNLCRVIKTEFDLIRSWQGMATTFGYEARTVLDNWENWKEATKNGIECFALFERKANKITTTTENLGIEIENTTIIHDEHQDVYVALTGDEVALTDIRIMK